LDRVIGELSAASLLKRMRVQFPSFS